MEHVHRDLLLMHMQRLPMLLLTARTPIHPPAAAVFLRRMALAIDAAVRASSLLGQHGAPPPEQRNGGGAPPAPSAPAPQQQQQHPGRRQAVHALQLVRARPFYGYQPKEQLYIKVVL